MLQSQLLANTLRETPSDAEAVSHQLLLRAGFIRQLAAGVYTYLPLGRRVLRKIEHIIREEMEQAGAQELLLPALQPVELWQASGRDAVYGPELMRLQDRHKRPFVLGPTHEEVISSLAADEIRTHRKLPVILYQIQTKFRDERRPRYGLLRAREFTMKDAYSFDADGEGLNRSYAAMAQAYHRIFARCGIRYRAVEADAGAIGGEGGSHEFIAFADIGEDTIAACTRCDYAANLEHAVGDSKLEPTGDAGQIREGTACLRCGHGTLTLHRGIELGHVFKLGTRYSAKLGAVFTNTEGKEQPLVMGCYGIGVSRMLSAIVEQHHDGHGIVWPEELAPYRVHLIQVSGKDERQVQLAAELYGKLRECGIEVLWDNREERPGVKFKDADLIGMPIRIVVGKEAENGKVEWGERSSGSRQMIAAQEAFDLLISGQRQA